MLRRSWMLSVSLAVVALLALPSAAEKITLQVSLITGRDPNVNIVQDYGDILWTELLKQEFNKLYPDIELEFVMGDISKIAVAIAGGVGPDLVNGHGSPFRNLGIHGGFLDLTPFLADEDPGFLSNYWAPQLSAFQYDGGIFALPDYLGTMAMYYNVNLFQNAGINPPSPILSENRMDWDEFADIVRKLTIDFDGDGVIDQYGMMKGFEDDRVGYWLLAAGAEYYDPENPNLSALGSEAAIHALEYLQTLRFDYNAVRPLGAPQNWDNGGVAIQEEGSWLLVRRLGYDSTGAPKVPFEWNVFPMPIGPSGQRATLATTDGWAINRNTKYPEAAYAALKFLTGPVANEIRAKYVGLQPAHREVIPSYIGLMREINRDVYHIDVHVFTDAASYAYPQYFYPEQGVVHDVFNEAYRAIFVYKQPVRSTWLDAIRRVNAIIQEALEQ